MKHFLLASLLVLGCELPTDLDKARLAPMTYRVTWDYHDGYMAVSGEIKNDSNFDLHAQGVAEVSYRIASDTLTTFGASEVQRVDAFGSTTFSLRTADFVCDEIVSRTFRIKRWLAH